MESTFRRIWLFLCLRTLSTTLKNTTQILKFSILTGTIFQSYSTAYYYFIRIFCRWSPENKPNLDPYAFMPFGMGPRNCVAMRFALEEVKLILCTIVKQFRFFPVEETSVKFIRIKTLSRLPVFMFSNLMYLRRNFLLTTVSMVSFNPSERQWE